MKNITYILLLFSLSAFGQRTNNFNDSTNFARSVRFAVPPYIIQGAGSGKVLTSDANGRATWQTFSSTGVTQGALEDSISAVRAIRKVDTIYKSLDSIVFKINGIIYSVKDSIGVTNLSGYVPYIGATGNVNIGLHKYIGTALQSNISAGVSMLNNTATPIALFGAGGGINSTFYGAVKLDGGTANRILSLDASKNIQYTVIQKVDSSYLFKNATRDSICMITIINGNTYRSCAFDSTGTGTVTSVATDNTLTGGTITTTGTLKVDTTIISTKGNVIGLTQGKQATLVSGTNIKTINSNSLLGSGNITTPDNQTLSTTYADSITLAISGGNSIKFSYAVDSFSITGDSAITFKGGTRRSFSIGTYSLTKTTSRDSIVLSRNGLRLNAIKDSIGSSSSSSNGWADSVGTTLSDTLKTAYRKGNLIINGMMVGNGRGNIVTNTAMGIRALNSTTTASGNNCAFGQDALSFSTTGTQNSAFGFESLKDNSTSAFNAAFGWKALTKTTAERNTAFGHNAGAANITGVNNCFFGAGTGAASLGSYNCFFGESAGRVYTNNWGTAYGSGSLYSATNGQQTAIGANALLSTTGADNVGVGFQSGQGLTSGTNNFLGGKQSGYTLGSGSDNVMIGYYSGNAATGSSNTFYGSTSGQSITVGAKNTYIGRYTGSSHITRSKLVILSDGDGTIGLFIDSIQRVGIGNVIPTAKLSVQGSETVSTSTPTAPNAASVLEVQSTTQGFRIVPMTSTQASAITPVEGLILFTSDTNATFVSIGLWCYQNGTWKAL